MFNSEDPLHDLLVPGNQVQNFAKQPVRDPNGRYAYREEDVKSFIDEVGDDENFMGEVNKLFFYLFALLFIGAPHFRYFLYSIRNLNIPGVFVFVLHGGSPAGSWIFGYGNRIWTMKQILQPISREGKIAFNAIFET